MNDFWCNSGYHLLDARPGPPRRLGVTDDFLRAYLMRPEIRPVEESCAAERALHASLLESPRRAVKPAEIAALADADMRDNYALLLAFLAKLAKAGTVEDAYLGHFVTPPARGAPPVPPLFLDQLAHVVLRHALDGAGDPMRLRAAELLYRSQRITVSDGATMAADEETVEMHAARQAAGDVGLGAIGELLKEAKLPARAIELDVMTEANGSVYWGRDETHDLVLDLTFGRAGLDALARVLETWVAHFLGLAVSIQPMVRIDDERWVWHVGLDAEASAIMNDLYRGETVDEARLQRIVALFRLDFADPRVMRSDIAGRPVYLGLGMDADKRVRLKPQNLLVNLPLAARA
ncbi:MAG: hypothetical protein JNL71_09225 [Rhodospirillales bacterium]|nr:hypothetical protein [Rhodospirillales bacterium]